MLHRRFGQVPGFNDGNACFFQQLPPARRVLATGYDDAFGPAPQHGFNKLLFLFHRVAGVTQKQLQAGFSEGIGNAAGRIGKVGIVDGGNESRHKARAL